MPEAFEQHQLILHFTGKGQVPGVGQDGRNHASLRFRAWMTGIQTKRHAWNIDVMLWRPNTREDVCPRARFGEGPEFGIDCDQGIDSGFRRRAKFLIGNSADDLVPSVAPSMGRGKTGELNS